MKKIRLFSYGLFLFLALALSLRAGPKDPIDGAAFENLVKSQNVTLQNALREVLSEAQGYIVVGPLEPRLTDKNTSRFYHTVRVICPNLESQAGAANLITALAEFAITDSDSYLEQSSTKELPGYRGVILKLTRDNQSFEVQLQTLQQLRFLIWAKDNLLNPANPDHIEPLKKYATAVSDYLYLIDKQKLEVPIPKAADFKLPESADIYAPAPAYVIDGYQNYKDYLFSHAEIVTDFTKGFLGFVPTAATLEQLKAKAAGIAYPNKESPLLQEEFKKFVERGGQMSSMRTLTKAVFDTLGSGEYFFAVGLNGNVRFGRELTREEVAKIEETGKKPARANHAFLFPGEPIMTAGAFFIDCEIPGQLSAINTQSGHYFYSNITATIKEDIAQRSDSYFITVGHFLKALDNLGINYDGTVISKL